MQYFICDCAGKIFVVTSIGGSVVEFSPATRETGVRFPANAIFVFYMNAIFYIWLCRANCWRYKHWWFSGRILACHAGDRGSIPRNPIFVFYMNAIFYMWLCRENWRRYKHWWFSGRILACHAGDRGSIPRQCNLCFLHECNILYMIVQGKLLTLQALVVQW